VPALVQETQAQTPAGPPPKALAATPRDTIADPVPHFFTPAQFATLRKLSDTLLPAIAGNPGALDAGAPEFLDFLIGESPAARQQLYRSGLDLLNARATKQFNKPFASLDAKEADSLIRPLLVKVPWAYDPPKDPGSHFITAAHEDIRTATRNSRAWADAARAAGRRVAGPQLFWNPIDPIYKG
jgi:hypothetical protein